MCEIYLHSTQLRIRASLLEMVLVYIYSTILWCIQFETNKVEPVLAYDGLYIGCE